MTEHREMSPLALESYTRAWAGEIDRLIIGLNALKAETGKRHFGAAADHLKDGKRFLDELIANPSAE